MHYHWQKIAVSPESMISDALRVIDAGGLRMAIVVDSTSRLLGVVSDGDIRRGLLRHIPLEASVAEIMNRKPHTVVAGTQRDEIFAKLRGHDLLSVPIVDDQGFVVGLESLRNMLEIEQRDNLVFLMAGGFGTRLKPLTDNTPKPMLHIGGKPILENILERFIADGFRRFCISVHYKAQQIKTHFGDGSKWNVQIDFVEEEEPLGTGGALGLLPKPLDCPIIMMNGDLLTRVNFGELIDYHAAHDAEITMCAREYDFQIPYGVIQAQDNLVVGIEEKPIYRRFINAGIYVLSANVVRDIRPGEYLDMPTLIKHRIASNGRVTTFPIHEYWLDVGRIDDFERAQAEFGAK